MRDKNGSSVMFQCRLHHLPCMDLRMVDGAGEQRFMCNQPVLVIEEECGKFFTLQLGKPQTQPVPDGVAGRE